MSDDTTTQQGARAAQTVVLEAHGEHWRTLQERALPWLETTGTLQGTFRRIADRVGPSVDEPHIRAYLLDVAKDARRHESVVRDVYGELGLSPRPLVPRRVAARLLATGRQAAAQAVGSVAGARSSTWRGMREMLRSNLDAISGFAVTEQIGLTLGAPAVVDLVLPVLQEKQTQQLLLQEYLLETASTAILYRRPT